MRSLRILIAVACLVGPAGAERVPSRAELGKAIADLELKIAAVREEARRGDPNRAATEERLAAIEKALAELRAAPAAGADQAARVDELTTSLEELREEAATKADLKKYVRKP